MHTKYNWERRRVIVSPTWKRGHACRECAHARNIHKIYSYSVDIHITGLKKVKHFCNNSMTKTCAHKLQLIDKNGNLNYIDTLNINFDIWKFNFLSDLSIDIERKRHPNATIIETRRLVKQKGESSFQHADVYCWI